MMINTSILAALLLSLLLSHASNGEIIRKKEFSTKRSSIATSDQRKYRFSFSCHHDKIGNEHTTSTVTILFFGITGHPFKIKTYNRVYSCGTTKHIDAYNFEGYGGGGEGSTDLDYVKMHTNGDDGLLVAWASIKTYKKMNGHWQHEATNNYGMDSEYDFHCMSTDPDDWETSDKGYRVEPCKNRYRFYIDGDGFVNNA